MLSATVGSWAGAHKHSPTVPHLPMALPVCRIPMEALASHSLLHTNPSCQIGQITKASPRLCDMALIAWGTLCPRLPQAPESAGCENHEARSRVPKQSLP